MNGLILSLDNIIKIRQKRDIKREEKRCDKNKSSMYL